MTKKRDRGTSRGFGPEVIQLLIPHRRPFLMVDRVETYSLEERLTLSASRYISANEEVFAGHFPGWSIWPGVYTIEGLGQCCMLLSVLTRVHEELVETGRWEGDLAAALHNLELGYRLRPGYRPRLAEEARPVMDQVSEHFGLGSIVNVKLLQPVFAGQRLDYSVEITRKMGAAKYFDVEASVEGRPVAQGTLGSSSVSGLPIPRANGPR